MTIIRTPHTATSTHSLRHKPIKTDPSLYSWQRCFARGVDYAICGLLIIIVLPVLMTQPLMLMFFIPLLWVILEPICLLICGTTVGKALFGLRLISYHTKPKYFWRSIAVWIAGMGCGIPVISLLTALKTAMTLQQKGEAYWDNRFGFQVIAEPASIMRTMLLTIAVMLIVAASGIWKKATYLEEIQVAHIAATTPPAQTEGCTGDCLNGFGTYVYVDGSQYEGYWKQGEHSKEDPALALTPPPPPPAENQVKQTPEITAQPQGTNIQLNISPEAAQQLIAEYNKTAKTPIEIDSSSQEQLARSKAKGEAQRQAEYDDIRAKISEKNSIIVQNSSNHADRLERIAKDEEEKARQAHQTIPDNYARDAQYARAVANEEQRHATFSLTDAQVREAREEHIRQLYRTMPVDTFSTSGMAR
ncbi:hypothetical protein BCS42_06695 [Crenothrix sp. D3]|nr:hypothetical protein BCS42_06695 [Crenothrix sp. D3]